MSAGKKKKNLMQVSFPHTAFKETAFRNDKKITAALQLVQILFRTNSGTNSKISDLLVEI